MSRASKVLASLHKNKDEALEEKKNLKEFEAYTKRIIKLAKEALVELKKGNPQLKASSLVGAMETVNTQPFYDYYYR